MNQSEKERLRNLLCQLGNVVQANVIHQRASVRPDDLSAVSSIAESDTIYSIDKFSEEALLEWFSKNWPVDLPVEVVAEGLEAHGPAVFPQGTRYQDTKLKVIIDPIDGTRELMYDKRSAWVLAGIAPQRFEENRLGDIEVAMMTELPVSKQLVADQISGYRACGKKGIVATRIHLGTGAVHPISINPSTARTVEHGVAALVKFFPEGKELIARFETDIWRRLGLIGESKSPVIFDDQYISTGGQMYGLLVGHYRFFGDMRPEALSSIGLGHSLTCHPYDVAAGMLLEEAGCIYESSRGSRIDAPMDTVTPVSWVAYANSDLADLIRPELLALMEAYFPLK